jgi:hypothetical protein
MPINLEDGHTIRKYLLGDMSAEEQQEVELWLVSDDKAGDLLEAAEDELIDDSLRGELSRTELDHFNNHFLNAPERKRNLQFSRSLHRFIGGRSVPEPSSPWLSLRALFQFQSKLAYSVAAVILVMVVGTVWMAVRRDQEPQRVDSTRDVRQKQAEQARAINEDSKKQTQETTSPTLLAVNLLPNLTRTASDVPNVSLKADTQVVQFSLALLDDNYAAYGVSLRDADGKTVWNQEDLKPMIIPGGKAIVFTVPGALFGPGDYAFTLSGLSQSQPPETINTFLFRTKRNPS